MVSHPPIDWPALRTAAQAVARLAYAPYSGLQVGAAALVTTGEIVTGCNVENASYGLTLCAECGLITDLARSGGGQLVAISIVDGNGGHLWPCGRCRQLLHEHGGPDLQLDGPDGISRLEDLLPHAFGPEHLPPTP